MPLLPCPNCNHKIAVVISQAGSQISCPGCEKLVPIPNLGELRRLAANSDLGTDNTNLKSLTTSAAENQASRRILFGGLMAIAGTAAIVGLFCIVRFLAVEVPETTQSHIMEIKRLYSQVPAAQLVREWQQMEKFGLDVPAPYKYKKLEVEKNRWKFNGLICLTTFIVSTLLATGLGLSDSRRGSRARQP